MERDTAKNRNDADDLVDETARRKRIERDDIERENAPDVPADNQAAYGDSSAFPNEQDEFDEHHGQPDDVIDRD
jgi:hypothetical protein